MTTNIMQLRHINKHFQSGKQKLHILNDLNMEVAEGSVVVISGESGAGKSTLLHIIGGLDSADSGEIMVAHHRLHDLHEQQLSEFRSTQIGFIFQSYYLLNDFNALENIMMPALIAGVKHAVAHQNAVRLLEAVHLQDRALHFPNQLSGGEQQRVAFARALINSPAIILADEPTGNLDEENSRVIESMLFTLAKNFNKTLVVVTHDQRLAVHADQHLVLTHGKIVRTRK